MKEVIRNKNSKGKWHGYNTRHRPKIHGEVLATRANWKNDRIIGYHERHTPRFEVTSFYIR